jgi:TolA-binding protein
MKKTLLALVTAAALMAATTSPLLAQATGGSPGAQTGGKPGRREHHPEIRQALKHLQMAKQALSRGSKDFSGHREKALDLTNQAIQECQQALQSDKQ